MVVPVILLVLTAIVFALWFTPLGFKAGIWGGEGGGGWTCAVSGGG